MTDLTTYWRRAFRTHDPITLRLARGMQDFAVSDWGDAAVVDAILGKAERRPASAATLAMREARDRAREQLRHVGPKRARERRIVFGLLGLAFALVVAILLAGCGGGDAQTSALTGPANHPVTTLPVDCGGGVTCQ